METTEGKSKAMETEERAAGDRGAYRGRKVEEVDMRSRLGAMLWPALCPSSNHSIPFHSFTRSFTGHPLGGIKQPAQASTPTLGLDITWSQIRAHGRSDRWVAGGWPSFRLG